MQIYILRILLEISRVELLAAPLTTVRKLFPYYNPPSSGCSTIVYINLLTILSILFFSEQKLSWTLFSTSYLTCYDRIPRTGQQALWLFHHKKGFEHLKPLIQIAHNVWQCVVVLVFKLFTHLLTSQKHWHPLEDLFCFYINYVSEKLSISFTRKRQLCLVGVPFIDKIRTQMRNRKKSKNCILLISITSLRESVPWHPFKSLQFIFRLFLFLFLFIFLYFLFFSLFVQQEAGTN